MVLAISYARYFFDGDFKFNGDFKFDGDFKFGGDFNLGVWQICLHPPTYTLSTLAYVGIHDFPM